MSRTLWDEIFPFSVRIFISVSLSSCVSTVLLFFFLELCCLSIFSFGTTPLLLNYRKTCMSASNIRTAHRFLIFSNKSLNNEQGTGNGKRQTISGKWQTIETTEKGRLKWNWRIEIYHDVRFSVTRHRYIDTFRARSTKFKTIYHERWHWNDGHLAVAERSNIERRYTMCWFFFRRHFFSVGVPSVFTGVLIYAAFYLAVTLFASRSLPLALFFFADEHYLSRLIFFTLTLFSSLFVSSLQGENPSRRK